MIRNTLISFWGIFLFMAMMAGFAAQPQQKEPTLFSVQMHSLTGDKENHIRALKAAKQMGAGQVRDELFWHLVEKQKGIYRIPLNCLENVDLAVQEGLDLILILDYSNNLYDQGMAPTSKEALEAFAGYCAHLAKELKGKVCYFEIWNEPNTDGFWKPKQNARDYTALLKVAYTAIKKANPEATVLGCSLAGLDHAFFDVVVAEGGLDFMDALSIHTYCPPESPEQKQVFEAVHRFSEKANRLAGRTMPLWITEMGWPTQKGGGVSELRQAEMVARTYLLASSYPEIKTLCWYWLGPDGTDEYWAEDRFSLTHQDGTPKPGRIAYKTLSKQLQKATFEAVLIDTPEVKLARYNKPDSILLALWSADDRIYSMEFSGKKVEGINNIRGFSIPMNSSFDNLRIEFDGEPLFIEYHRFSPSAILKNPTPVDRKTLTPVSAGGAIIQADYLAGVSYRLFDNRDDPAYYKDRAYRVSNQASLEPHRIHLITDSEVEDAMKIQALSFINTQPLLITIDPVIQESQNLLRVNLQSTTGPIHEILDYQLKSDQLKNFNISGQVAFQESEKASIFIPIEEPFPEGEVATIEIQFVFPDQRIAKKEEVISFLKVPRLMASLFIDGNLSDWDSFPAGVINLGKREQYQLAGMTWDGTKDASSRVRMVWDPDWLYFAAEVRDDVFSDPATGVDVYKNDGFELYFDMDLDEDALDATYNGDDHQWGICASKGRAVVYRWNQQAGESEKGVAEIRRTTTGYIIEAKIPADELVPKSGYGNFMGKFETGLHIGFTLALNDDDSPEGTHPFFQDLQLQWSERRNAFMDPSAFADLFFVE